MDKRIGAVDGFRCIAILSVILYHYYYRYAPPATERNYYPYHVDGSLFKYGFYGVQLFFVISGFVIFQTLGKTKGIGAFVVKRLIRLMPALVICSVFTWVVVALWDPRQDLPFVHSRTLLNFLPSLTFFPPGFWNALLGRTDIAYLDGVYWSLYTEIIFYGLASIIYFMQPGSFLSNWVRISLLLTLLRILTAPRIRHFFPAAMDAAFEGTHHFLYVMSSNYFVYFALGIFFYSLYQKQRPSLSAMLMVGSLALLEFIQLGDFMLRLLFLGIIALFAALVYRNHWLGFLKLRGIVWLGLISYPFYLLHQYIGIVLIHRIAGSLTHPSLAVYVPIAVALFMVVLSSLIYVYWERPVCAWLKRKTVDAP